MDRMHEYLVREELERYRFGWIGRRDFIRRATLIGLGGTAAAALAAGVVPAPLAAAPAQQESPFHVAENDPAVGSDHIWYPSTDGKPIYAYYRAWPVGADLDSRLPGVIVCHQNAGLNPQIEDVARRFAKQGYVAVAPDLVSRIGPPASELSQDDALKAFAALDTEERAWDLVGALDVLKSHPSVDASKLAAMGFCAGGGVVWRMLTIAPDLKAAAPFYGSSPPLDRVPNIRAAVLAVYAELDTNLTSRIPAIEAAMQAAGTRYRITVYPDSLHAFFNDANPRSYNPETATQAWMDTLNWFAQYLGLEAPRLG